jgi:hypothetical protein
MIVPFSSLRTILCVGAILQSQCQIETSSPLAICTEGANTTFLVIAMEDIQGKKTRNKM